MCCLHVSDLPSMLCSKLTTRWVAVLLSCCWIAAPVNQEGWYHPDLFLRLTARRPDRIGLTTFTSSESTAGQQGGTETTAAELDSSSSNAGVDRDLQCVLTPSQPEGALETVSKNGRRLCVRATFEPKRNITRLFRFLFSTLTEFDTFTAFFFLFVSSKNLFTVMEISQVS